MILIGDDDDDAVSCGLVASVVFLDTTFLFWLAIVLFLNLFRDLLMLVGSK